MKRKVILVQMLCIVLIFTCCSCGLFGRQKYICEIDKVKKIEIVRLDKYVEGEYRFEYTTLSQISNIEKFVKRLNEIDHSVNWGDPRQFYIGYVVIRIEYHNGDFDLIHKDAQWFNTSGKNNYGFFFFDDEQFEALISDYKDDK